jgi:hypothetical protein
LKKDLLALELEEKGFCKEKLEGAKEEYFSLVFKGALVKSASVHATKIRATKKKRMLLLLKN